MAKKTYKSEYNRGARAAKQKFSARFKSYKKLPDGRWVGNKIGGSTEIIGTLAQHKGGKDPFFKGWYDVMKKDIDTKKIKPRKAKKTKKKFFRDHSGNKWEIATSKRKTQTRKKKPRKAKKTSRAKTQRSVDDFLSQTLGGW
tara:strand:- start:194 stop:619 length:426 start_codon:yes stop_codon:yes gene_type:complete